MKTVVAAFTGESARSRAEALANTARRDRRDAYEVDDDVAASFAGALHAAQQRLDASPVRPRVSLGAELGDADVAVDHVDRSLDHLSPEFRSRLERVIERMEREFGHDVRLVEGFRAQERQEHLYAQGRTRPGPVVTWTLASAHTDGRAADLLVDGSYDNPLGYERLARVARQEGLRTLGAFDQGHVELPANSVSTPGTARESGGGSGAGSADAMHPGKAGEARNAAAEFTAGQTRIAATSSPAGVAQVASVARVARVATVAPVARVASFGGSGAASGATSGSALAHGAARTAPAAGAASAGAASVSQGAAAGSEVAGVTGGASREDGGREPGDERSAERGSERYATEADSWSAVDGGGRMGSVGRTTAVSGGAGTPGTEGAERVARIAELQDAADAQPLSRITLRLEDADGGPGRIRIDLRGGAVDADVSVADPREVARLEGNTRELRQALQREGLTLDALRAHTTAGAAERGEALRPGIATSPAENGAANGSSTGESQRERRGGEDAGEAPHRDPGSGRQRSPREHNGRGNS